MRQPPTPAALLSLLCLLFGLTLAPAAAQDSPTDAPPAATETSPAVPIPTRATRIPPESTVNGTRARLELYFRALNQGRTGLARVSIMENQGDLQIANARALFLDGFVDFFGGDGDGVYGLLAANMEQATRRENPLDVYVTFSDGTRETLSTTVDVVLGEFIRQTVTLPPDTAYLLDAATERNELAQLSSIFSTVTLEKFWDSTGFAFPVSTALTSPFGAFRTFNEAYNTRHTGWDLQVTLGTPVMASAAGRVIFAGFMPIRGSHVVIDHGYGVFSGYSHLSTTHVTRGQGVAKGQVIGTVGSSGRVSGPHFHWEMAVNGSFVDGAQFVSMWMP
ncbi:MAG: M23 family metallopeptidase [Anaerolineae bacterium]|nr:M23 family metallopeptidase [Anaerolineae bacterium]